MRRNAPVMSHRVAHSSSRRDFLRVAAVAGVATAVIPRTVFAGDWKVISREKGVVVSLRNEADREFPTFRGVGRVDANLWEILAVLEDADRHTEWMHKCVGAREVERISATERLIYNRTDAPWPVSDRDVVLRSTFKVVDDGNEIWARFKSVSSSVAAPSGVIRMPSLVGHYHLMRIDDDNTLVEYQVNADPGGTIPDWLVREVTKDLPMHTVANLRKQVRSRKGKLDTAKFKSAVGVAE